MMLMVGCLRSCFVVWRGVWFRGWLVWWVVDLILRVWCVLGV